MRQRFLKWLPIWLSLFCLGFAGCGLSHAEKLLGRWSNKDVSMRFRENGTVLYNSRITGLVEGRYRFDPKQPSLANTKPVKNLTLWLPQPKGTQIVNFEVRLLGSDRLQIRPIPPTSAKTRNLDSTRTVAAVLKRAAQDEQNAGDAAQDGFDETPPLVSASPGP